MSKGLFLRAATAGLLGLVAVSLGCDRSSGPAGPSASTVTITAISPKAGLPGVAVRVTGTGFTPSTTLTLGAVAATINVPESTATELVATAPDNVIGTVDVVVTNPGGQRATLAAGFTFDPGTFTVTAGASSVSPGGELSVNWTASTGRPLDWIALFKIGAPNTSYDYYKYTNGATSGTLTLVAPKEAGEYEVRYLLNDGYNDVARSGPVTVR
jgi:IPT/TIG domain-containing protein